MWLEEREWAGHPACFPRLPSPPPQMTPPAVGDTAAAPREGENRALVPGVSSEAEFKADL